MCYSPRIRPKYSKTTSCHDALKSCTGGHKQSKSARYLKILPRERPKYAKTTSFHEALKSCIGGHKLSKSARNPKTIPRKRPKYAKTTSFHDALKSSVGRNKPSKSARNPTTVCYSLRNVQNIRKRRVFSTPPNHVSGVKNHRNRPGTLKQCAIAHETSKICENDEFSRRTQIVYRVSKSVEIGPEP